MKLITHNQNKKPMTLLQLQKELIELISDPITGKLYTSLPELKRQIAELEATPIQSALEILNKIKEGVHHPNFWNAIIKAMEEYAFQFKQEPKI